MISDDLLAIAHAGNITDRLHSHLHFRRSTNITRVNIPSKSPVLWCSIYSAVVMKSGSLNFLEPSGPLQACNGTALPLPLLFTEHWQWIYKTNLNIIQNNDKYTNLTQQHPSKCRLVFTNLRRVKCQKILNLLAVASNSESLASWQDTLRSANVCCRLYYGMNTPLKNASLGLFSVKIDEQHMCELPMDCVTINCNYMYL